MWIVRVVCTVHGHGWPVISRHRCHRSKDLATPKPRPVVWCQMCEVDTRENSWKIMWSGMVQYFYALRRIKDTLCTSMHLFSHGVPCLHTLDVLLILLILLMCPSDHACRQPELQAASTSETSDTVKRTSGKYWIITFSRATGGGMITLQILPKIDFQVAAPIRPEAGNPWGRQWSAGGIERRALSWQAEGIWGFPMFEYFKSWDQIDLYFTCHVQTIKHLQATF